VSFVIPTSERDAPAGLVRVLLVEDHPMVRHGMRAVLDTTPDLRVCAEASTPEEALAALEDAPPDVVCLDLILGQADGISLIRAMLATVPRLRILVLSVRDEDAFAERCLRAGALGYAMKTETNESLITALRRVAQGKVHLSPRVAMHVLQDVPRHTGQRMGIPGLTDRELQVFQLIGLGWTTRQISAQLGIGIKTVETHRENIKNKLRIEHTTALVREATRWVQQSG
jgi:DNA-binding NarL/FixJ family response regulator